MLNVLDVFCGAGGFSEGFRQAGFRIAAGTDVDPDACATYARNFPDATTVCGDLTKAATRSRVLAASRIIDVVVGGPPCQAFSQVRNHDRVPNDPRNRLYRQFLWLLKRVQPRAFVMENVPGLAQLRVQEPIARDPARLVAAAERQREGNPLFTNVVHVSTDALKAVYGNDASRSFARALRHVHSGRIESLGAWLSGLQRAAHAPDSPTSGERSARATLRGGRFRRNQ